MTEDEAKIWLAGNQFQASLIEINWGHPLADGLVYIAVNGVWQGPVTQPDKNVNRSGPSKLDDNQTDAKEIWT